MKTAWLRLRWRCLQLVGCEGVTAGKFLQLNLVMSPNSELRLYKLTIGLEQRQWHYTNVKSYKDHKKSPIQNLNWTLHPFAPTPFFPCLYKLCWKVPLTLSQVLALVTLEPPVKSISAEKNRKIYEVRGYRQYYRPLLTNDHHCTWTQVIECTGLSHWLNTFQIQSRILQSLLANFCNST